MSMAAAFKAAGYQAPGERLLTLALEAWGKHPKASAGGARRDHVREAFRGELLFHLMVQEGRSQAVDEAIEALLTRAAEALASQRGRDHHTDDNHRPFVPPAANTNPAGPAPDGGSGAAQMTNDGQRAGGRSAPSLTELADRQFAAMQTRWNNTARLSRLDTVVVGDRKLGDLTAGEARQWAGEHELKSRFIRAVTSGLASGDVIRDKITPDEADEMYLRAQAA